MTSRETPEISVVVTLPDDRGHGRQAVESWVAGQTLERERFEVLVAADGADPELEAEVDGLLGAGDRLVRVEGAEEIVLTDAGARAARGRLLLMTESHCIAEPDCLEQLLAFFERTNYDGACVRSTGISATALARMENRLYEQGFVEWSSPGHWCKVILRGFAIYRDRYLEAGGFESDYGRFAEFALAATIHDRGWRLGYASEATVAHVCVGTFGPIEEAVDDFARGEMAYRFEHPRDYCERYFGAPSEWLERRWLDPGSARTTSALALRTLVHPRAWVDGSARAAGGALRRRLGTVLLGRRSQVWRARWRCSAAQARTLLWRWHDARLERAYLDTWQRMESLGRVRFLAEQGRNPAPMAPARRFGVAELPDERLCGFHSVERSGGEPFRWSGPVAFVELPVQPGSYEVRVETPQPVPRSSLHLYFNGRRLQRSRVEVSEGAISFSVDPTAFSEAGDQRLGWACATIRPSRNGSSDSRELGVPVSAIEFR